MLLCFCVSLTLHTVLFVVLVWHYVRQMDLSLLGWVRPARTVAVAGYWGEAGGIGQAHIGAPGDRPQQAMHRFGHEQPALTRQPSADPASIVMQNVAESPLAAPAADPLPPAPQAIDQPFGVINSPQTAVPHIKTAQRTSPTKAGAVATATPPYPQSQTESDPFSASGSAVIHRAGKVEARFGRQMKLVRPRLTLKAEVDLATYPDPTVVLLLKTDATGKVVNVSWPPLRSSGSNEIDTPVYVAAWEWWFEPPKDAAGNPRPDSFKFSVSIVTR